MTKETSNASLNREASIENKGYLMSFDFLQGQALRLLSENNDHTRTFGVNYTPQLEVIEAVEAPEAKKRFLELLVFAPGPDSAYSPSLMANFYQDVENGDETVRRRVSTAFVRRDEFDESRMGYREKSDRFDRFKDLSVAVLTYRQVAERLSSQQATELGFSDDFVSYQIQRGF